MEYKDGWNDDHGALVHYENGVMSNFNGPARVYTSNLSNTQFFFNGHNRSKEVHKLLADGTIELNDEGMFTEESKVTIQLMYGSLTYKERDILSEITSILVKELHDEVEKSIVDNLNGFESKKKKKPLLQPKDNGIEW